MLGLSHRQQLIVLVFISVLVLFVVWAKVDYAVEGYGGHHLPEEVVPNYWFWMWTVGVPAVAGVLALAYYAGAPDTERNLWYALGIFLTPIILAWGQLEDFLFFALNMHPFPSGDWTWMLTYNIFGAWTTAMHLIWLCAFLVLTVGVWFAILEYA